MTQQDDDAVVVIRRYGNRRLYDTRASAYVNLHDVRALVREGKKIRVVDATTEEDVTRRVLTQIVLESAEEEGEKGLSLDLLYELARASDRAFRDFLDWYLKSSHEVYQRLQERWQADARRRWGDPRPAFEAWAQLWDPRQVAASLSQLLSPFDLRAGGASGTGAPGAKATDPKATDAKTGGAPSPDGEIDELRRRLDQLEQRRLASDRTADGDPEPAAALRLRRQAPPAVTAIRDRVVERFQQLYRRAPEFVVRAPGRVSLLGGHVDYNEGWVLPAAIDRAVWLAAGRGVEQCLRASSLELGEAEAVPLAPVPGPAADGGGGWIAYPAGVAWALATAGHPVAPLDAVVGSDLPAGAGLSSSAALEVAFLVAWRELGGLALDEIEMARLGRRVENEYVGVQSGIMDQFASLAGRRDHAVFLDCRTLEWERLPLPAGVAILIADCGVRRRLTDGPLNDRRAECAEALRLLRESRPELRALRDVDRATLEAASDLPESLRRRTLHVVEECERVRRGAELLRRGGEAAAFGALMRDSHRSSRDLYQVSLPELDTLAEAAWAAPGCHGARLVGAGFGGCVVALVEARSVGVVAAAIEHAFAARFERMPRMDGCGIADGAALA